MDYLIEDFDSKITKADLRREYHNYCRKHKLKSCSDKVIKAILSEMFGAAEERYQREGQQIPYWQGVDFNEISKGSMDSMGFSISTAQQISHIGANTPTKSTTHTYSDEAQKELKPKIEEIKEETIEDIPKTPNSEVDDTPPPVSVSTAFIINAVRDKGEEGYPIDLFIRIYTESRLNKLLEEGELVMYKPDRIKVLE